LTYYCVAPPASLAGHLDKYNANTQNKMVAILRYTLVISVNHFTVALVPPLLPLAV